MHSSRFPTSETALAIFREISQIPRGSGHTKQISDYCVQFAQARGLRVIQEPCNNVIIFVDATPGYEQHPTVIVQGHLDMVCEKELDCSLNMETDGLRLRTDGDFLSAEGTTLGADDGIAVACALALLEQKELCHPPLELLFTVDEETSMVGAYALHPAPLQGRRLLNMDSEGEGILTVGCAGGCTVQLHWNGVRTPADTTAWTLTVDGLRGGHSGADIGKGRANADILLGRTLQQLGALRLARLSGGTKSNAIPRTAEAVCFLTDGVDPEQLAAQMEQRFRAEFGDAEPELTVRAARVQTDAPAFSAAVSAQVVELLATMPNGVQCMSEQIPGLVQTSLNLGILRCEADGICATVSLRSSVDAEKAALRTRLTAMAEALGAQVTCSGEYPAWEYKPESRLRDLMCDCYEELTGRKAKVETIHAGLECGLLGAKLPGLDAVSFGPDMYDIHTTRERLSLSSTERTWQLLCCVLERL